MNQPVFVPSTILYGPNLISVRVVPPPNFYPVNMQMPTYHPHFQHFPSYKEFNFQQMSLHKSMWLYQKQLQDCYSYKPVHQATTSVPIKFYQDEIEEQPQTKVEEFFCKAEAATPTIDASSPYTLQQSDSSDCYNEAVTSILDYLLSHLGKATQEEIEKEKLKYAQDSILIELFDALVSKYKVITKPREDTVRFVMRKSITWLRDQMRIKCQLTAKAASVALCHRYFTTSSSDLLKNKTAKSDDDLLGLLLPYKKNSRHPVVNSQFIKEIFISPEFCQDYLEYLEEYSKIVHRENRKRVRQFTDFVLSCVRNDSVEKVLTYKRPPWLDVWADTSQQVANELYDLYAVKGADSSKKVFNAENQSRTK